MTFLTTFGTVKFEPDALAVFKRYQQSKTRDREAGGQLYAREFGPVLCVRLATPPHPLDRRTRSSYIPDRRQQQREIDTLYASGYHYIGDWHTHPEACPRPSNVDFDSMRTIAANSKHELCTLLFVIVGSNPDRLVLDVRYTIGIEVHNASTVVVP